MHPEETTINRKGLGSAHLVLVFRHPFQAL
jgi:hypothetical protein